MCVHRSRDPLLRVKLDAVQWGIRTGVTNEPLGHWFWGPFTRILRGGPGGGPATTNEVPVAPTGEEAVMPSNVPTNRRRRISRTALVTAAALASGGAAAY